LISTLLAVLARGLSATLGVGAKGKNRMAKAKKHGAREHRIEMEIVVDAYGPEEQAMYASPSGGKTCVKAGYGISG
jgi:hypothetical protein